MRRVTIGIGAAAAAAVLVLAWFQLMPTAMSSHPRDAIREANAPRRLAHRVARTAEGHLTGIVNQDSFAWHDVHVEVGAARVSFQCPTLPLVASGASIPIRSSTCHAAAGETPSRVCVVRVAAREGELVSAFEPCLYEAAGGGWR